MSTDDKSKSSVVAIQTGRYYRRPDWVEKRYAVAEKVRCGKFAMEVYLVNDCGISEWNCKEWHPARNLIQC